MEAYKHKLIMVKEQSYEYDQHLSDSKNTIDFIQNIIKLQEEPEEVMILIGLNSKNNIIGFTEVARGSINTVKTTGRELFKRALAMNCTKIIIAHNHPSGDATPSKEDIVFTNRIKETGAFLDIQILDSIIIGDNTAYSLTINKEVK